MAMSELSPVNGFEWVEDRYKIDEDFIKKTMIKIVTKDIFLK